MSNNSSNNRRIIAVSSLVLLLSAGFLGRLIYLQNQLSQPAETGFPKPPAPALVAETEKRKKDETLLLRTKWEKWAKTNQVQLRAMLAAQPSDTRTLNAITSAIPSVPSKEKTGIDLDDLGGADNPSDPANIAIQWTHMPVGAVPATPELAEGAAKAARKVLARDGLTFAKQRDVIVITTGSTWSKKQYLLWASGRVSMALTEIPELNKQDVTIAPPYDFLVSPDKKS